MRKLNLKIIFLILSLTICFALKGVIRASDVYQNISLGEINNGKVSGDLKSGFIAQRIGGNNMAVFDARITAMEFEADMEVLDGTAAAGLMFGVGDKEASNGDWSAVHIQPGANAIRVFCEKNWSQADGFDTGAVKLPAGTSNSKMHLKISIDTKDTIKVYVNDMKNPVVSSKLVDYNGGHVGIMTFDTKAKFTNIKLKGIEIPKITGLEIEDYTLEEEFSEDVFKYTVYVDGSVESIKLKVTLNSGKFVVNKRKYDSGMLTSPILLRKDINVISIGVLVNGDTIDAVELTVVKGYDTENAYEEVYRPQFHYSQQRFWANDPNGLVYNAHTQEYHMFYQYNPRALDNDGWHHWGHAVSKDLVHWTEYPIALYPDEIGTIASGSAVIDYNNTSGLFDESVPPASRMVMIYTYFANSFGFNTPGREQQAIVYSEDNGYTWKRYEGNPVIPNINNEYDLDFRDPKVIWMEDSNEWLMVIAGGKARIFTSPDLINWTYNSNLTYTNGTEIVTECPDLFPLAVNENIDDIKWVFTGGGLFYVVGDLVKENGKYVFKAETDKKDLFMLASYGWAMYATQSFSNTPDGRRILVSWMPSNDAAGLSAYDKSWNGIQSIPLEAKLIKENGELKLTVNPISELEELRTDVLYSVENLTVNEGDANILSQVKGKLLDIEASFAVGSATEFGFNLRKKDGDMVIVKYSVERERLTVDTNNSSITPLGVIRRTVSLVGNKLTLRILVDLSIIDVFANGGEATIDTMYYTNASADGMEFYTVGGDVTIDSLKIYGMSSAWVKEDMVDTSPLLLGLQVDGITLSQEFNPFITEYSSTADVAEITLKPEFYVTNNKITVRINGKEIYLGESEKIKLYKGENKIFVTIADEIAKRTYALNINCVAADALDPITSSSPTTGCNSGCSGSAIASLLGLISLCGVMFIIKRKQE